MTRQLLYLVIIRSYSMDGERGNEGSSFSRFFAGAKHSQNIQGGHKK